MTEIKQFRLPDVGEGLTEADIVSWHVKAGEKVAINQVIVEIETAKAVVELPCPFEGVVAQLLVDEGQTVDVGTPIIAVETSGGDQTTHDSERSRGDSGPAPGSQPAGERQAVLVGYGVKPGATTRRPRKSPSAATASTTPVTPTASDTATTSAPPATRAAVATPAPGPRPQVPAPRRWLSRRCASSPAISAST